MVGLLVQPWRWVWVAGFACSSKAVVFRPVSHIALLMLASVAAGSILLALAKLAVAQDGTISLVSPTSWTPIFVSIATCGRHKQLTHNRFVNMTVMSSDTEAYIGKAINITFEASAGVTGPYDVDLYRGDEEVHPWCSVSQGCDIPTGSISVPIPSSVVVGDGYKVVVTDRGSSNASGTSKVFQVVEPPATAAPTVFSGTAGDTKIIGGDGAVGHMNMAMFAVAAAIGVILIGAAIWACIRQCKNRRRKPQASMPGKMDGVSEAGSGDIESQDYGRKGGPSAVQDTFSPTDGRSVTSAYSGRSLASAHPFSLEANSDGRHNSSRSRGESRSRCSSRERDATTTAAWSRAGSEGPRMMSTTQARIQQEREEQQQQQQAPNYDSTPGTYYETDPDSSRSGRRMYSGLPDVGDDGGPRMFSTSSGMDASRDDQGRLVMYGTTTSEKARGLDNGDNISEDHDGPQMYSSTPPRSDRAGGVSRSTSVGRDRRPRYSAEDGPSHGEYVPQIPLGQRSSGRTRHRSPNHKSGYQRSRSVEDARRRTAGPEEWEQEVQRRREAKGIMSTSAERWDGAGDDRRVVRRSKSVHAIRETDVHDPTQSITYDEYRRTLYDNEPSKPGSDGGYSAGTGSPGRHRFYRSGLADAPRTGHDVSCEELRWRHIMSTNQRRGRDGRGGSSASGEHRALHRLRSLPKQPPADNMSALDSLSIPSGEDVQRGPPPPYRLSPDFSHPPLDSPRPVDTAITAGSSRGFSKQKSSAGRHVIPRVASNCSVTSTGQVRAMHARAAARDAQLSAERALAAAAAASRAADAAARAATEAEAEADAELGIGGMYDESNGGGTDYQRVGHAPDPVKMNSATTGDGANWDGDDRQSGYNRHKKIRANNGGDYHSGTLYASANSRHVISHRWSQEEELEVKAKAETSAEHAKAAIAAITLSSGLEENGVAAGGSGDGDAVTGGDTAGGSHFGAPEVTSAVPPRGPRVASTGASSELSKSGTFAQQSSDSEYSLSCELLPSFPSSGSAARIPSPLRPLPRAVADEEALPKILSKRRHTAVSPPFKSSPTAVTQAPVVMSTTEGNTAPNVLSADVSSSASTVVPMESKRE